MLNVATKIEMLCLNHLKRTFSLVFLNYHVLMIHVSFNLLKFLFVFNQVYIPTESTTWEWLIYLVWPLFSQGHCTTIMSWLNVTYFTQTLQFNFQSLELVILALLTSSSDQFPIDSNTNTAFYSKGFKCSTAVQRLPDHGRDENLTQAIKSIK